MFLFEILFFPIRFVCSFRFYAFSVPSNMVHAVDDRQISWHRVLDIASLWSGLQMHLIFFATQKQVTNPDNIRPMAYPRNYPALRTFLIEAQRHEMHNIFSRTIFRKTSTTNFHRDGSAHTRHTEESSQAYKR